MAGHTHIDLKKLKELAEKGVHPDQIANRLGVSPTAVIDQLHRLKIDWKRKPGGSPKLPVDFEKQVIELYTGKKRMGATSIARQFSICKKTVYNILNRHNIGTRSAASRRKMLKMPKNPRITERDLQIKKLFLSNMRISEIAKELCTYDATVRYSLRKLGLYKLDDDQTKIRQRKKASKGLGKGAREVPKDPNLNHEIFSSFDEHACYWIGFLLADGNIHQRAYGHPRLTIQLCLEDIGHLQKLKSWLGTGTKIRSGKHVSSFEGYEGRIYEHCILAWSSKKQATFLSEMGVKRHKDVRFVPDSLQDNLAFWRGLVDGDGCIYAPEDGTLYLSGQPNIIDDWTQFCERITGTKGIIRREDRPRVSIGSVRFKQESKILLRQLYGNATIYLDRKHAKAQLWDKVSFK